MSICQIEKIKIYSHVSITDNIDKYNLSSDYYNDLCYTLDDEKYDIILNDRKNNFYSNNYSICEENCIFEYYDFKFENTMCSCDASNSIQNLSHIDFNIKKVVKNIKNINYYTNINVMKCAKTLFTKNGIIKNIASYFFIYVILICICLLFLFIKKELAKFFYFLLMQRKMNY